MKQNEKRTPYTVPEMRCIDLKLASVILGSNTPGDPLPWDPGDDETLS
jgi:hypothetical protein